MPDPIDASQPTTPSPAPSAGGGFAPGTDPNHYIQNLNAASLEYGKDYQQFKTHGTPIDPQISDAYKQVVQANYNKLTQLGYFDPQQHPENVTWGHALRSLGWAEDAKQGSIGAPVQAPTPQVQAPQVQATPPHTAGGFFKNLGTGLVNLVPSLFNQGKDTLNDIGSSLGNGISAIYDKDNRQTELADAAVEDDRTREAVKGLIPLGGSHGYAAGVGEVLMDEAYGLHKEATATNEALRQRMRNEAYTNPVGLGMNLAPLLLPGLHGVSKLAPVAAATDAVGGAAKGTAMAGLKALPKSAQGPILNTALAAQHVQGALQNLSGRDVANPGTWLNKDVQGPQGPILPPRGQGPVLPQQGPQRPLMPQQIRTPSPGNTPDAGNPTASQTGQYLPPRNRAVLPISSSDIPVNNPLSATLRPAPAKPVAEPSAAPVTEAPSEVPQGQGNGFNMKRSVTAKGGAGNTATYAFASADQMLLHDLGSKIRSSTLSGTVHPDIAPTTAALAQRLGTSGADIHSLASQVWNDVSDQRKGLAPDSHTQIKDNVLQGSGPASVDAAVSPVRPVRRDQLASAGLPDTPGGLYVHPGTKENLTGKTYASGSIDTTSGKPSFKVDDQDTITPPLTKVAGATVKTNLFAQKAGWSWVEKPDGWTHADTPEQRIVSVETRGQHLYTLATDQKALTLRTYPDAKSEPRLRPTTFGVATPGRQIGVISVRGRQHPVYDQISVAPRGSGPASVDAAVDKPKGPAQDPALVAAAQEYNRSRGLAPISHEDYLKVDPAKATEMGNAHEAAQHTPSDPKTVASYNALKHGIDDQWDYATKQMGMTFKPWTQEGQPYATSKDMMNDVRTNHNLHFFTGGDMPHDHPLAQVDPKTGLTYNDKLRAVHDMWGHAVGGYEFGPRGEKNAWNAHRQMFPPEAASALAAETKMQNSWVNFHGDNPSLPATERPFADQKAYTPDPRFLGVDYGIGDKPKGPGRYDTPEFKNWFGDSKVVSPEGKPKPVYHGTAEGGFTAFSPAKDSSNNLFGPGHYFTENKSVANSYQKKFNSELRLTDEDVEPVKRYIRSDDFRDDVQKAGLQGSYVARNVKSWAHGELSTDDGLKTLKNLTAGEHGMTSLLNGVTGNGPKSGPETFSTHLSIKNPLDIDKPIGTEGHAALSRTLDQLGAAHNLTPDMTGEESYRHIEKGVVIPWLNKNAPHQIKLGGLSKSQLEENNAAVKETLVRNGINPDTATQRGVTNQILQKSGYDGITHIGGTRWGNSKVQHRVHIAFEPTQIKSVKNSGSWDSGNPDINMAITPGRPIVKAPDHQITGTGGEDINFRNRDVVQPGEHNKISIEDAWDHIQKHGGKVGGTMYDRTMVGKYVPRYADSGIDYDLHGGPRYAYDKIAEGKLAGAALSRGMSTTINRMADRTNGPLMIAVGDHNMSVGNTDFSKVYDLETKYQIKSQRKNSDGLRLTRNALDEAVAKAAKPHLGDPSVKTWAGYMAKHESYTFDKRNKFLNAVGGKGAARTRGTVPVKDVLGGFNHHHDVPTGHVVSMVHIEPGQDTGVHASRHVETPHPGYAYGSKGYPVGVLDKPFPAHTLFSGALRQEMVGRGKSFTGSDGDVNFLLPKGYLSVTTPNRGIIESIKRGERVGQDEQPIYNGKPVEWGFTPPKGDRPGDVNGSGRSGVAAEDGPGDVPGRVNERGAGRVPGSRLGQSLGERGAADPGVQQRRGGGTPEGDQGDPWGQGVASEGVKSRYLPHAKAVVLNENAFRELVQGPHNLPAETRGALFSGGAKDGPLIAARNAADYHLSQGNVEGAASYGAIADHLQQALTGSGGHSVLTVKHDPSTSLQDLIKFTRHEGIHAVDAKLGKGQTGRLIKGNGVLWKDTRYANNPAQGKLQDALERLSSTYIGKSDIEGPAYLGTDDYQRLGLSRDEADSLLQDFVRDLVTQHGRDQGIAIAQELFTHGRSVARGALDAVKSGSYAETPKVTPFDRSSASETEAELKGNLGTITPDRVTPGQHHYVLSDGSLTGPTHQALHDETLQGTGAAEIIPNPAGRSSVRHFGPITDAQLTTLRKVGNQGTGYTWTVHKSDGSSEQGFGAGGHEAQVQRDFPGGVDPALGKFPIPTNAEELSAMRKAGLLSAPKTMAKIVTSHLGFLGMEELSRLPASLLDGLVSHLTGRDRTIGNFSVPQLLQAAKVGATKGVKEGFTVLRKGSGSVVSPVASTHPPLSSTSPILNAYVNKIMGTHDAVYHALRTYALHRSLLEQAQVVTMNEVRKGVTSKSAAAARQQDLYNSPTPAMLISAISSAEEATFQSGNQFSKMWAGAYDKGGPVGKLVMDQVLPFPKVPSNVGLQAAQYGAGSVYAPLRFAAAVMRNKGFTPQDQQQLSRTFGRGVTGAALIGLGVALAHKGITTPSDEKHFQPGTIKIGGKLFPTNTVAPMMSLVQLGIDLTNAKEHHDRGEPMGVGQALGAMLSEQPMLKLGNTNPEDLLSGDVKGQKLLGQQLGSFVPTALSDFAASTDTVKRDQKGVLGPAMNRVPGLREKLNPKLDLFGNPVPEGGNKLFDFTGARAPTLMDTKASQQMQYDRDNPVPKDPADAQLKAQLTLKARAGQLPTDAIRSAVQSGQLSRSAGALLYRGNQSPQLLDPRIKEFTALPLDRAAEVYRQSNPQEKGLFGPVLQQMIHKAQFQNKPVAPGVLGLLR